MHLTHYTNYALRVLMYLDATEKPARIVDIAHDHKISRNHLIKIVHQLARHGYLIATRGRGGGITLARPAEKITVGEIVRLTEDHMNLVECFGSVDSNCKLKSICRLRCLFGKALRAFNDELDRTTIADISRNKIEIKDALGINLCKEETEKAD